MGVSIFPKVGRLIRISIACPSKRESSCKKKGGGQSPSLIPRNSAKSLPFLLSGAGALAQRYAGNQIGARQRYARDYEITGVESADPLWLYSALTTTIISELSSLSQLFRAKSRILSRSLQKLDIVL